MIRNDNYFFKYFASTFLERSLFFKLGLRIIDKNSVKILIIIAKNINLYELNEIIYCL